MLTLYINGYGGWHWTKTEGQRTKVVFDGPNADALAADYISRKGHLVIEAEDYDPNEFPMVEEKLYPSCEHGLSASLCAGPDHYPMENMF